MTTREKIEEITTFLKENVFKNTKIMFNDFFDDDNMLIKLSVPYTDKYLGVIEYVDLIDIIASLHNLLYEAVTGERYDYMFHWCNKIGCDCLDDIFDGQENDTTFIPI
ncbi:MAG: hypothetical protein IKT42_04190 [Clostridia bacterium]|nr:hypothetical protein [Clostridia bacterium]